MQKGKPMSDIYSEITPQVTKLAKEAEKISLINPEMYEQYEVKRGLRSISGKGVTAGLTEVSRVVGKVKENDGYTPCPGRLYYRGVDVNDLINGFYEEKRFGFEEAAYLLLFGSLPDKKELQNFSDLLKEYRDMLPANFVREIIMACPSSNMMNVLARSVLTLYAYDEQADDTSIPNVLRQCLQIISMLPEISVYGYQIYQHYYNGKSLYIHPSNSSLAYSENILHLLRKDMQFTPLEARLLDIALVLHMEHGGGTNSTFTNHVVSSSMTDTYSVFAASLGSLKGPRHGGISTKVVQMMEDLKQNVSDWKDEDQVAEYLRGILSRENFDHTGQIYGMGHAVYSLSDPRAEILKAFAKDLCEEKQISDEYNLYCLVDRLAPLVISEKARIYKGVCSNVDFYSGFVYSLLNLPVELFTPMFAIARSVGWSAHRIEELSNQGKIIRPSYQPIGDMHDYVPMKKR